MEQNDKPSILSNVNYIENKLKELEIKEEKIEEKEIDPRWNKLRNILIDKNTSNGTS